MPFVLQRNSEVQWVRSDSAVILQVGSAQFGFGAVLAPRCQGNLLGLLFVIDLLLFSEGPLN